MRALNRPNSWWGWHGWNQPTPMSVTEIIRAGTMPSRLAALLWVGFERGASVILAADPPGAGKTTVLTALLAFAPPQTRAYFTQGWGETFDLPPVEDGAPTYLLVNEMSDHLPVYSWGPYVTRIFELLGDGYSLASTVHADTAEDVVGMLEQEVGVPREHLRRLTFIVPLLVGYESGRAVRRVLDVAVPLPDGDGPGLCSVGGWDGEERRVRVLESPEAMAVAAARLGMSVPSLEAEVNARARYLDGLLERQVLDPEATERAVAAYNHPR